MRKTLTAEQKQLFTERKKYSDFFNDNKHACLLGLRGTGKTLILKSYAKQKKAAYIDLSRISISPENFAVEYVGSILHSVSEAPAESFNDHLDIDFLTRQKLSNDASDIIKKIENELQKIKPDQALLLKLAFSFPVALSKDKKFIILLDEFQELLALNNYAQVDDILEIFFEGIKKQDIEYKLAGSSINLLKRLLDKRIPLTELTTFNEKESKEFCAKQPIHIIHFVVLSPISFLRNISDAITSKKPIIR